MGNLENKFEKEWYGNKEKWRVRMVFEPGYALKNVLSKPKELRKTIPATIMLEVTRLATYAFLAYTIYRAITDYIQ